MWIDTGSLDVDALLVARHAQKALTSAAPNELRSLLALYRGDFLEGLSSERAPWFENWLAGQRHRFGDLRQRLLERLSAVLPPESDERIDVLRDCIDLAPLDEGVHIELVRTLVRRGLHSEAEQQIGASLRRFQSDGIDPASLETAFAMARRSLPKRADISSIGAARHDLPAGQQAAITRGPTLLLMPFTAAPEHIADADSVTSDIIFGFAKLRSISVIARGTAFALRNQPATSAATRVDAQYVVSGHLRRDGMKYLVSVELVDPNSHRIFWADEFSCNAADFFAASPRLAAQIIVGIDTEIHIVERNRALLTPPASLDAWQAYHRGLASMYRFTDDSNREAQRFFAKAIALDPTFSRNYAGLSFTHFQNAFHLHVREPEREIASAIETAEQALYADPNDPAAHCAMGRALWLQHAHDSAVSALHQSVRLSPNYAFAHYSLAFVQCQTGDPGHAIGAADIANQLSPLDPMMFGTNRVRTFALLRLGKLQEAAETARQVGRHAGDHVHAHAVAALTLAAAGRIEEARAARRHIGALRPQYNFKQFKAALHMLNDLEDIYRKAAELVQIPSE